MLGPEVSCLDCCRVCDSDAIDHWRTCTMLPRSGVPTECAEAAGRLEFSSLQKRT
jgi:hypothetical protein